MGGAVGWTHNLGRTIVKSASIQNGLVRIDSQQNDQVRPWIEVHAWFVEWGRAEKTDQNPKPRPQWGFGPFVAVAPGANFVDAVAMGAMIGRKYRTDSDSNLSFNLAFGAALNLNQQVLGDGFNANQPPPPGETSVRYKNTSTGSFLMMFSVGWDAFAGPSPTKTQTTHKQPEAFTTSSTTSLALEVSPTTRPQNLIGPEIPACLNARCVPSF